MSTKNIFTGLVVLLALLMVVAVLLATGVIGDKEDEQPTVIETAIVEASATNEFGDVTFYTMVSEYVRPGVSSDHTYKRTTAKPTEPPFEEVDSYVYVTNEDGSPVYGDDGKPVTQVIKVTVDRNSLTTEEPVPPETYYQQVTDESGNPVLDENGNPVTEAITVVVTEAPTTDRWAEESRSDNSFLPDIDIQVGRDDALAENIVSQINADRSSVGGRAALSDELSAVARQDSAFSSMAIYNDRVSGRGMTFVTTYGGSRLYADIARAMSSKIHSDSATKIGVGVTKTGGKYYTTVIIE